MIAFENFIWYCPTIFNDRDWDSYYFIVMMKRKLDKMEKFYRSGITVNAAVETTANEIHHVSELIQRWIDDDYFSEEIKSIEDKWGEEVWGYKPTNDPDLMEVIVYHPNSKSEEDDDQINKEMMEAHKRAVEKKNNDFNEIMDFLKDNLHKWLD